MDGWERGTQKGQLTQPLGQGGLPRGELIEVNKIAQSWPPWNSVSLGNRNSSQMDQMIIKGDESS